ncbi:hypothetical protein LWI28_015600 [Acer negundo]|uniref:Uncharacterized protein n=1 Tax=Acer negundo TaxID=4023 RepID=A0AAD5NNF4_ACENE|nr:hypothetical protein LWI28_015600 [Acer negundo]
MSRMNKELQSIKELIIGKPGPSHGVSQVTEEIEGGEGHFGQEEQTQALREFQRQRNDQYSTTYNPGLRNHPNLSWSNNNHLGATNYQCGNTNYQGGNTNYQGGNFNQGYQNRRYNRFNQGGTELGVEEVIEEGTIPTKEKILDTSGEVNVTREVEVAHDKNGRSGIDFPVKLLDPESFVIEVGIENSPKMGAVLNMGASINMMPLKVYKQLKIQSIKPTS